MLYFEEEWLIICDLADSALLYYSLGLREREREREKNKLCPLWSLYRIPEALPD